jgi:hypothetical protein
MGIRPSRRSAPFPRCPLRREHSRRGKASHFFEWRHRMTRISRDSICLRRCLDLAEGPGRERVGDLRRCGATSCVRPLPSTRLGNRGSTCGSGGCTTGAVRDHSSLPIPLPRSRRTGVGCSDLGGSRGSIHPGGEPPQGAVARRTAHPPSAMSRRVRVGLPNRTPRRGRRRAVLR